MDNVTREEFEQLRQFVLAMDSRYNREKGYDSADKAGIRQTEGNHGEAIKTNASDIADNRVGIEETYESSIANADDIADVRTALEEVYEMLETEE